MHRFPRTPKNAIRAGALALAAGIAAAGAFSPDGEAWLDALRARIAAGRGGEEAYQEALRMLADDPQAGCADWEAMDPGTEDPAWAETLGEACPAMGKSPPDSRRKAGAAHAAFAASKAMHPRAAGPEPARW